MTDTTRTLTDPALAQWAIGAAQIGYTDFGGDGEPLLVGHGALNRRGCLRANDLWQNEQSQKQRDHRR